MEKEQKFVDYLTNLKNGTNDQLINIIMEGFSAMAGTTLIESSDVTKLDNEIVGDIDEPTVDESIEEIEEETKEMGDDEVDGAVAILKSMYLEIKKMYKELTGNEFNAEVFDTADSAIMESEINGSHLLKLMEMVSKKANLLESITPEDANAMTPEEARIKLDELSKMVFRMVKVNSISQEEADEYLRDVTVPLIKRIQGNQA